MNIATARQAQADGLGTCRNCAHEYKDSEASHDEIVVGVRRGTVIYETITCCPKCTAEDDRVPYWCNLDTDEPLHTPNQCNLPHHNS